MATIRLGSHAIEYALHGPSPEDGAPTLVFFHEGLGSVAMWRDFPARVAEATGLGALVYSRRGYGGSDPLPPPWPVTFMHAEAQEELPRVLDAFAIRDAILVGHSDGASIALIHAGSAHAERIRGIVVEAPHVFVEDVTVASIGAARDAFQAGGALRRGLERYHGANTESAFRGWSGAWLDPAFRAWNIESYLPSIRVPVLVIQGENDEYGTLAQVDAIQSGCASPVTRLVLPACGHSPHRDQPAAVLAAITTFVRGLLDGDNDDAS
ncbi:MAG TPA: alpha/beta hydrolase [Longimicrobiaceae bacterium]|jgi:pimeloyl-ACP methyl ester carboxylesterase|nr:alpha/beta hydrolase [Longimicrobiaceae bacterium]